jgi:hypothetical protein
MVSIGEQSIGLDGVCRIIRTIATGFSPQELNVGLSALTIRGDRHSINELKATYSRMFIWSTADLTQRSSPSSSRRRDRRRRRERTGYQSSS